MYELILAHAACLSQKSDYWVPLPLWLPPPPGDQKPNLSAASFVLYTEISGQVLLAWGRWRRRWRRGGFLLLFLLLVLQTSSLPYHLIVVRSKDHLCYSTADHGDLLTQTLEALNVWETKPCKTAQFSSSTRFRITAEGTHVAPWVMSQDGGSVNGGLQETGVSLVLTAFMSHEHLAQTQEENCLPARFTGNLLVNGCCKSVQKQGLHNHLEPTMTEK